MNTKRPFLKVFICITFASPLAFAAQDTAPAGTTSTHDSYSSGTGSSTAKPMDRKAKQHSDRKKMKSNKNRSQNELPTSKNCAPGEQDCVTTDPETQKPL